MTFPTPIWPSRCNGVPGVAIDRVGGEGRTDQHSWFESGVLARAHQWHGSIDDDQRDRRGGTNRTRAFDFNVFASELFNQIAVRKTSSAEVDEGSLGATIDLFTARPLNFEGF